MKNRKYKKRLGKPIGGGREGVRAGRQANVLLQSEHNEIIWHMYVGLPGPLRTSFAPPELIFGCENTPDEATLTFLC